MTALDLPAIRALLAGATPGPWEAGTLGGHAADVFTVESDEDLGRIVICEHAGSDAAFIAAAPSIVTQLLAVVEAVMEVHQPLTHHFLTPPAGSVQVCHSCREEYPCPTIQAITGEGA